MTIKDRFLKQWRKNFEEFTPPELKILHLQIPEVDSGSPVNDELAIQKLDALQVDLEHTHDLIFKIRNELKRAKFCQSWLQREFTRCRKHSERLGSLTTPDPSEEDEEEDQESPSESPFLVDHEEEDHDASPQEEIIEGEEGEEEPLYMNLGDEEEIGEESDSDHDYEYLYDNTPFIKSRMPPSAPPPQHNGSPDSPIEPRSPSPSADPDSPDYNITRSYSIDKPDMTTAERLGRPTLALPAGLDSSMPSALIAEAQKKRLSANFATLSPVDPDSGKYQSSLTTSSVNHKKNVILSNGCSSDLIFNFNIIPTLFFKKKKRKKRFLYIVRSVYIHAKQDFCLGVPQAVKILFVPPN